MHNNKPLTIGIVACSAEGAALCYRTICSSASEIMGKHAHPNIVLHSVSLADYVEALDAGDHQAVADIMLHSANQLALAGADFFGLSGQYNSFCNGSCAPRFTTTLAAYCGSRCR